jgi:thiol-disulfide isomerase/thioredoxin
LAGLLLLAWTSQAEDVRLATLKAGSETYSNVVVTTVTATDIYFSHSRGLGNAKLKSLDPELQKRFHYDPAKAAQKEKQQASGYALYTTGLRETKTVRSPKAAAEIDRTTRDEPASAAEELVPYRISAKSVLNQPTPPIEVEKWLTDRPDLSGKFILVDFWATWCGPCRQSIPGLNALHHKFKDRLIIIGLSDEDERTVRNMGSPAIEYFIAIDPLRRSSNAIRVRSIPHALLIDPKGIVRFEGHPAYLDEKKLAALLSKYAQ